MINIKRNFPKIFILIFYFYCNVENRDRLNSIIEEGQINNDTKIESPNSNVNNIHDLDHYVYQKYLKHLKKKIRVAKNVYNFKYKRYIFFQNVKNAKLLKKKNKNNRYKAVGNEVDIDTHNLKIKK